MVNRAILLETVVIRISIIRVDYGFYVHRKFKGEHLFYMLFYIFYKMCEAKHLLQYLGLSFSFLRVSLYS